MAEPRIVTFTSDFGLQDAFVGIMHGVVLNIEPETRIVDICHAVASYDVLDGALGACQAGAVWVGGGCVAEHAEFADL